jgi:hypothetical protein
MRRRWRVTTVHSHSSIVEGRANTVEEADLASRRWRPILRRESGLCCPEPRPEFRSCGVVARVTKSSAFDGGFVSRAIEIAAAAHAGQVYPSPRLEPFIEHPFRVMNAVDGPAAKAAAALHDVLEDSDVTVEELREKGMPREVVDAVIALTRTPDVSYEAYIERVAVNPIAREVKLADVRDNLANNLRLPATPDVVERIGRYERAIDRLADVNRSPADRGL